MHKFVEEILPVSEFDYMARNGALLNSVIEKESVDSMFAYLNSFHHTHLNSLLQQKCAVEDPSIRQQNGYTTFMGIVNTYLDRTNQPRIKEVYASVGAKNYFLEFRI